MLNDEPWYAPGPCPKCGARVKIEPDCPGYSGPGYSGCMMVCWPPCGNATLYRCERWLQEPDEDPPYCDWEYRVPNNRRDAQGPPPTEWAATDVMP